MIVQVCVAAHMSDNNAFGVGTFRNKQVSLLRLHGSSFGVSNYGHSCLFLCPGRRLEYLLLIRTNPGMPRAHLDDTGFNSGIPNTLSNLFNKRLTEFSDYIIHLAAKLEIAGLSKFLRVKPRSANDVYTQPVRHNLLKLNISAHISGSSINQRLQTVAPGFRQSINAGLGSRFAVVRRSQRIAFPPQVRKNQMLMYQRHAQFICRNWTQHRVNFSHEITSFSRTCPGTDIDPQTFRLNYTNYGDDAVII